MYVIANIQDAVELEKSIKQQILIFEIRMLIKSVKLKNHFSSSSYLQVQNDL